MWGSRWLNGLTRYMVMVGDDSSTVQLSLVDAASHPLPVHNATRDFIIHIPRDEGSSVEPEVVEPRVSNTMPLSIHKVEVPLPNLGVSVLVMPASGSWPGLPRSSMVLLNTLKISSISMNLTITLTQDSMSYFWTLRQ
ncbi:hypothetical protein Pmani_014355 [Petrolisthes manimaculis]|uniref:Uncharacterized protein n=1 Tax=Petrolisthes manimaculis TaxID=1843537 RepID=A0AAE1PUI2_9EUCA|nr:hypothetical protein Pmani_014355 [Petrolisthes manimaculis]